MTEIDVEYMLQGITQSLTIDGLERIKLRYERDAEKKKAKLENPDLSKEERGELMHYLMFDDSALYALRRALKIVREHRLRAAPGSKPELVA